MEINRLLNSIAECESCPNRKENGCIFEHLFLIEHCRGYKTYYNLEEKEKNSMTKMTVNEAMVLAKAVRGRYAELSSMRSANLTRETYYATANEPKRVVEPTYDVKDIDRRCVELENFLLQVESKIKQSNAMTTIEIDADVKILLAPLA